MPEHEKDYKKYFEIKETPKRGVSLTVKQDAVDAAHERYRDLDVTPLLAAGQPADA